MNDDLTKLDDRIERLSETMEEAKAEVEGLQAWLDELTEQVSKMSVGFAPAIQRHGWSRA